MYLGLKDIEEAFLAYLLAGLWPLEDCAGIFAESATARRHDRRSSQSRARVPARTRDDRECLKAPIKLFYLGHTPPLLRALAVLLHILVQSCPEKTGREERSIRRRQKK